MLRLTSKKFVKLIAVGALVMPFQFLPEPKKKKKLLFIMTDQQRYVTLNIGGNIVLKAPNLDRLALQGSILSKCIVLSIDLNGFNESNNIGVRIINLMGQTVYSNKIQNSNHIELDTSGILKSSVYIVTVRSGISVTSKK